MYISAILSKLIIETSCMLIETSCMLIETYHIACFITETCDRLVPVIMHYVQFGSNISPNYVMPADTHRHVGLGIGPRPIMFLA